MIVAVDAPLPTPATTADPTLPSSKYYGITPQMRKHHHYVIKRGIHAQFLYLDTTCVYLQDRTGF